METVLRRIVFFTGLLLLLAIGSSCWGQDLGLSEEQAISFARTSKWAHSGSKFKVIHELRASAESRRARMSMGNSTEPSAAIAFDFPFATPDTDAYETLLSDFLSSGGYSIAEYDPKTHKVIGLYLVSQKMDDEPRVATCHLGGNYSIEQLSAMAQHLADFMEQFLNTEPSDMGTIADRFFPNYPILYPKPKVSTAMFSLPEEIASWASHDEMKRASVLLWSVECWMFRVALSNPGYGSDPEHALDLAKKTVGVAAQSFVVSEGHPPQYADTIYDLEDVHSSGSDLEDVHSESDLLKKLNEIERLNAHFEKVFDPQIDWAVYKWNVAFSGFIFGTVGGAQPDSKSFDVKSLIFFTSWSNTPDPKMLMAGTPLRGVGFDTLSDPVFVPK